MLNVEIIRDIGAFEALAEDLRTLNRREAAAEITRTPTWLATWWRVFGPTDGRELVMVKVSERGRLVGCAPMLRRTAWYRRAIPFQRMELLATGEKEAEEICSPYPGFVAEAGREAAVASAIIDAIVGRRIGRWDELVLSPLREDDPVLVEIETELRRRGVIAVRESSSPSALIELPDSWDGYLAALASNQRYYVRKTLRNLEKYAKDRGGYRLMTWSSDPERCGDGERGTLETGLSILYRLHRERWSEQGRDGVFAAPRFRRFHEELIRGLAAHPQDGLAELHWLTIGEEPVAVLYNFVFDDRVYFYQSGRRLDVPKNVRAGIAVHLLAIQRAIELGCREYDFLEGEQQYKAQLATAERPQVRIRAVAPGMRGVALEVSRQTVATATKRLRGVFRERIRPLLRREPPILPPSPKP